MFILPNSSLTVHTLEGSNLFRDSVVMIPPTLDHYVTFDDSLCGYYFYFSLKGTSVEKESQYRELVQCLQNGITAIALSDDARFYTQKISRAVQLDKGRNCPLRRAS